MLVTGLSSQLIKNYTIDFRQVQRHWKLVLGPNQSTPSSIAYQMLYINPIISMEYPYNIILLMIILLMILMLVKQY